ncbi:hypothetical protein HZY91_01475 [Facklamia sp. DSM 111018]|uniref:Radical SAM protein n=1 Tax=Facklamia lactis TaxID=2749967 RepID=A0ABS0LNM2_9LACT|nr:hypothetical protein [Facklamia lactis]MBG9985562.1 hypothetical protein [Facklamia lactis]
MSTIRIKESLEKVTHDQVLNREDLINLLELEYHSQDAQLLIEKAREIAQNKCLNRGKVWGAIGLDYMTCAMNCNYCSLAKAWNNDPNVAVLSDQEILNFVDVYNQMGIDWLFIRTSEFYQFDRLIEQLKMIRERLSSRIMLGVNTGDANSSKTEQLKAAGVEMVYHAIRLREGVDTNFAIGRRRQTQKTIKTSGLLLSQYLEPIGPEHSSEEIADRMIDIIDMGTDLTGIMPRIPVENTPKYEYGQISEEKLAIITAVFRIYGQEQIKDLIIHPASELAMQAGANSLVVDVGAIPRSRGMEYNAWNGQDVNKATSLLKKYQYKIGA